MTFENMAKHCYFITFILKIHILAPGGKKTEIFTIFGHISAILEDFLTELEKMNETKKICLVDILFKYVFCFHIFSKERLQN